MKLEMILNRINPSECDIRFYEKEDYNSDGFSRCTTINLQELYNDWYDECNNCPENGTYIYAVQFTTCKGLVFNLDGNNCTNFTFEQLMDNIEKKFYQKMKLIDFINEYLINKGEEHDAIIGDVEMDYTLGMCPDWEITDYCKEQYGDLLESKCRIIHTPNDRIPLVEVFFDDYKKGERLCASMAGYVEYKEFDKLFGTHNAEE